MILQAISNHLYKHGIKHRKIYAIDNIAWIGIGTNVINIISLDHIVIINNQTKNRSTTINIADPQLFSKILLILTPRILL